jgi:hypothetical protein
MKTMEERVASRYAAVDFRQQIHKPAEADEALGQAYLKLVSFKQGIDAMEEIPTYLKPYYRQVLKAIDAVVDARKETTQLRGMVRKLRF